MKRFFFLLLLGVLACASAWGEASLIQVTHHKKDPRVQQHKAHKATKHKTPKRPHNAA